MQSFLHKQTSSKRRCLFLGTYQLFWCPIGCWTRCSTFRFWSKQYGVLLRRLHSLPSEAFMPSWPMFHPSHPFFEFEITCTMKEPQCCGLPARTRSRTASVRKLVPWPQRIHLTFWCPPPQGQWFICKNLLSRNCSFLTAEIASGKFESHSGVKLPLEGSFEFSKTFKKRQLRFKSW